MQNDTQGSHVVARRATTAPADGIYVLDRVALAQLLGVTAEAVKQTRSKNPLALPAPFMTRPLRWRRESVIRWMEQREREEAERIRRLFEPMSNRVSRRAV